VCKIVNEVGEKMEVKQLKEKENVVVVKKCHMCEEVGDFARNCTKRIRNRAEKKNDDKPLIKVL